VHCTDADRLLLSASCSKGATPKKRKTKKGKSEDEVGKGMCGHGLYGATFTLQMDSIAPHYLAMCYPYTYTELQVNQASILFPSGRIPSTGHESTIHPEREQRSRAPACAGRDFDTNPRFLWWPLSP
jgi:hypothetical protein